MTALAAPTTRRTHATPPNRGRELAAQGHFQIAAGLVAGKSLRVRARSLFRLLVDFRDLFGAEEDVELLRRAFDPDATPRPSACGGPPPERSGGGNRRRDAGTGRG